MRIISMNKVDFKQLIICGDCGLVWYLPIMKSEQWDSNKRFQKVNCLECGNTIYDERSENE